VPAAQGREDLNALVDHVSGRRGRLCSWWTLANSARGALSDGPKNKFLSPARAVMFPQARPDCGGQGWWRSKGGCQLRAGTNDLGPENEHNWARPIFRPRRYLRVTVGCGWLISNRWGQSKRGARRVWRVEQEGRGQQSGRTQERLASHWQTSVLRVSPSSRCIGQLAQCPPLAHARPTTKLATEERIWCEFLSCERTLSRLAEWGDGGGNS
jgi:hypothetical protein